MQEEVNPFRRRTRDCCEPTPTVPATMAAKLPCVSIAPLGSPVVPLV